MKILKYPTCEVLHVSPIGKVAQYSSMTVSILQTLTENVLDSVLGSLTILDEGTIIGRHLSTNSVLHLLMGYSTVCLLYTVLHSKLVSVTV